MLVFTVSEGELADAIRGFAGEDWNQAVVLPEEAHLLKETFVHHYVVAE